jgi:hypothetical protein
MKHPFQSVPEGSSNTTPPPHNTVKIMRMNKLVALFIIAIIISPNMIIVRGQTLTLAPFDAEYEPEEEISISGIATAEANLTLVVVFNSTILYEANFTSEGDGNYTEDYMIPGNATEGVYAVTISSGVESVSADFVVFSDDSEEPAETDVTATDDNSTELAETLIEQAEDLKDKVEDVFDDLENEEVPTEANSSYLQGIEYLDLAKEDFDEGNYTRAADAAFEALQHLGIALEGALNQLPQEDHTTDVDDDPADVGSDNEDAQVLKGIPVALERAFAYWKKLYGALDRFEENGYDVSSVRSVLGEAGDALNASKKHVEEGDLAAAREDFTRGRKVLGRINGLMNSSMKARKEKQAEKFLVQLQKRVEKISATVNGLQANLAASKTRKVKVVLESTSETLLNMSNSLSSGNMTDVLDELDDVVEELDDGLDELNGEGLSKLIKTVYRLEAKIKSLNESLQRMTNAGYNTSELDDYLFEAQSLLGWIEEKIREGDENAVKRLIEEAEELIENSQELLMKLQKNTLRASRVTENSKGRSGNLGRDNTDDDDEIENDHEVGDNVTSSSETVSAGVTDDLREIVGVISRIEERLINISTTGVNTTDIKILVENATTLIEEAKALAEENPDKAKELMEAAEELLDEVIDLIEGKTEIESNVSVAIFESDDTNDNDENDDDDEDSTNLELTAEQPGDVELTG